MPIFALAARVAPDFDQAGFVTYSLDGLERLGLKERTMRLADGLEVFKWKNVMLKAGETVKAARRHPIRPVTTRRYYAGLHRVEVLVNGYNLGGGEFVLAVEN